MVRFTKADQESIKTHVMDCLSEREKSKYRQNAERKWKEVDRLIEMASEKPDAPQGEDLPDWHNRVVPGDLADASEVITADVMRLAFPSDREWFRPHVEIQTEVKDGFPEPPDQDEQRKRDLVLRSLMTQQHVDTGLKERVKLSVKEALHHGSYVAEIRMEEFPKYHDGTKVEKIKVPVWVPHSMWDCYPDPSPTVIGTNIFYTGSMIIKDSVKKALFKKLPWINKNKVIDKDKDKEEFDMVLYYGDISVPRKGKDVFLPNMKVVVVEEVLCYIGKNDLPYSPIIYSGYERDDVRSPYYSSPLMKVTPNAKAAEHNLNKFLDAVDLRTEPPVAYDSLDPAFAQSGGPSIAPGMKIPTKGSANFKIIETADPTWALNGFEVNTQRVMKSTGVDATRSGVSQGTEQTAFEVSKKDQKSEIRTVNFVGVLERQGLRPYLYMQHDLNKANLTEYSFYNSEPSTPDFVRADKDDIKRFAMSANFEITGSRGVLGEEKRRMGIAEVTGMTLRADPEGRHVQINLPEIVKDAYIDVGVKDPERYVITDDDSKVKVLKEQFQEQMNGLQQQMQEMAQELEKSALMKEKFNAEMAQKDAQIESTQSEIGAIEEQLQLERRVFKSQRDLDKREFELKLREASVERASERPAQ